MVTNRRLFLKQGTLAALGLGVGLKSMAGEDYLPYHIPGAKGLLNLGSNENPYGISPKAKLAISNMMQEANRYQFNVASLQSFADDLASYYQVSPGQVLITAGSGEGLGLLARYFSNGNIVVANPSFNILQNTARKIGTEVIDVPVTSNKSVDLQKMLSAINDKTKLVYVVNPNNPTGTVLAPDALNSFVLEASKKTAVLIDEAYIDFVNSPNNKSLIALPATNENVLVMRTFSKIHGMAGLRIGFIVGHPSLIEKLDKNLFSSAQMCVSNLTLASALASLKDEDHRKASREKNDAAKNFTIKSLATLGLTAVPSGTNFIFVPIPSYRGDFAQDMLAKNVLLRAGKSGDEKWTRISIGTMDEMQRFISIVKPSLSN